ncbi:hypothetical protein K7X08_024335 [Anisodus acutangulus]|uniref:Uncharacterized protein n=1 Tax=Anisodus acutangulus TaxID=402998 RepID=A0A9Q1RF46_9SOLA|nr:hypothetical protein K7X08_024335 [Anisodus acutangulus]
MLEKQGVSSQVERAENPALDSTIGPSGTLVDSTCNEQSDIGPPSVTLVNSTCNEAGNTVGETAYSEPVNAVGEPTHEELCSNKQDTGNSEVFCPPPAEGGRNRWKDIGEDRPSIEKGMANAACSDGGNSVNPGSKSHVFAPPTSSPCPVGHLKLCSGSQVLQAESNSHVFLHHQFLPHAHLVSSKCLLGAKRNHGEFLLHALHLLMIAQQLFLPQCQLALNHQEGAFLVMGGLKMMKRMLTTSYN